VKNLDLSFRAVYEPSSEYIYLCRSKPPLFPCCLCNS